MRRAPSLKLWRKRLKLREGEQKANPIDIRISR